VPEIDETRLWLLDRPVRGVNDARFDDGGLLIPDIAARDKSIALGAAL